MFTPGMSMSAWSTVYTTFEDVHVIVGMVLCAMATASGELRYPRANERAAPAIDF